MINQSLSSTKVNNKLIFTALKQQTKRAALPLLCLSYPPTTVIVSAVAVSAAVAVTTTLSSLSLFVATGEGRVSPFYSRRLCEGGELLDRILSRGERYTEEDAKTIVVQILSVVAFCHPQGVVHHDLKPKTWIHLIG
ncbi:CDPK-related kinase 5 [Nymphaea thermarum]|nr:CDPK-related kinase 5 [Nymphaea thermarum]